MALIETKFIKDNAVTDTKILLRNDQWMRGRNAANNGDVNIFKVTSLNDLQFAKIPIYPDANFPTRPEEFASKAYVDYAIALITPDFYRKPVVVRDDVSLVRPVSVATVDGITIANGDRVLFTALAGAEAALNNQIFVASVAGGVITGWTVAADNDPTGAAVAGDTVFVLRGTWGNRRLTFNGAANEWIVTGASTAVQDFEMIKIDSGGRISVDLATLAGLESTVPGSTSGQLRVKVESANPSLIITASGELAVKFSAVSGLKQNGTGLAIKTDSSIWSSTYIKTNGELAAPRPYHIVVTMTATNIGNQYFDLARLAQSDSVELMVSGVSQTYGVDYSVSTIGGVSRITFLGDLASTGPAALATGDNVYINCNVFEE